MMKKPKAVIDAESALILRRTPSGMLVVRAVGGDRDDSGSKFKLGKLRAVYVQADKTHWANGHSELRDVPADYLPQEASQ